MDPWFQTEADKGRFLAESVDFAIWNDNCCQKILSAVAENAKKTKGPI